MTPNPINALTISISNTKHTNNTKLRSTNRISENKISVFEILFHYIPKLHTLYFVSFVDYIYIVYCVYLVYFLAIECFFVGCKWITHWENGSAWMSVRSMRREIPRNQGKPQVTLRFRPLHALTNTRGGGRLWGLRVDGTLG